MRKFVAKFALGLMMLAVCIMTTHVFSHAFSSNFKDLTECAFCKSLASTSAPGPALVLPKPIVVSLQPAAVAPEFISVAFIDAKPSRAPPLI